MNALLALIPFRDYVYAAAIAGLLIWGAKERHDLIAEGARHEANAVAAVTQAAEAQRTKELAAQAVVDQTNLTQVETSYESSLKLANANAASVNARLRDYLNASRSSVAVPSGGAAPGGSDEPAGGADDVTGALQSVITGAGQDAAKVIGLQQYITKECH
jgi:hypothetical protein